MLKDNIVTCRWCGRKARLVILRSRSNPVPTVTDVSAETWSMYLDCPSGCTRWTPGPGVSTPGKLD